MRVRFAHLQTADELIEELIRAEPHPKRVTVVSNDGQVQDSARHRGSGVLTCQDFVDRMIAKPAPAARAPQKTSIEPATAEEMAAWLEAFSKPKRRNP